MELEVLSGIIHPGIADVRFAFQDDTNLYLVETYYRGGSLRYWLDSGKKFSMKQGLFIIACLILNIEFLHQNGIIHRDIRPENVIFDEKGYCKLVDFGLARIW